jgi:hypothetical protein
MRGEEIMFMVSFLGFWCAVAFMVWVVASGRRRARTIQAMTEFHNRLLDKLGSARDFSEFLQSEGGTRFLRSLSTERVSPNQRILSSIQTGTVLLMLGLGLLVLGWTYGEFDIFVVLGTVGFVLGLGFLISSAVAYRLSRTWGVLEETGRQEQVVTRSDDAG